LYGENLTDQPRFPNSFTDDHLIFEGHRIELIALRSGESEHATALWIPSIRTVVAGDAVFNGVHVWLAGVNAERRGSWLRNLDSLRALGPTAVVGGHRAPGAVDSPAVLDSTAQYIRDFDQAVATSRAPEEVITKVTAAHGTRTLPIILELAAKAAFNGGGK
jgi:glyoxylase-like metal-dependent hydrolase (beta-lactamase superfamily II)